MFCMTQVLKGRSFPDPVSDVSAQNHIWWSRVFWEMCLCITPGRGLGLESSCIVIEVCLCMSHQAIAMLNNTQLQSQNSSGLWHSWRRGVGPFLCLPVTLWHVNAPFSMGKFIFSSSWKSMTCVWLYIFKTIHVSASVMWDRFDLSWFCWRAIWNRVSSCRATQPDFMQHFLSIKENTTGSDMLICSALKVVQYLHKWSHELKIVHFQSRLFALK